MKIDLETLCDMVEQNVPTAVTRIYPEQNQIVVNFSNRPDVEINLLTPYDQRAIQQGEVEKEHLAELLLTVRRIANVK